MPSNAVDKEVTGDDAGDMQSLFDQKMAGLEIQIDALYELMPFGAYSTASDGTCLSINHQALLWLGCSKEAILGQKNPSGMPAAENWRKLNKAVEQLKLGGRTKSNWS